MHRRRPQSPHPVPRPTHDSPVVAAGMRHPARPSVSFQVGTWAHSLTRDIPRLRVSRCARGRVSYRSPSRRWSPPWGLSSVCRPCLLFKCPTKTLQDSGVPGLKPHTVNVSGTEFTFPLSHGDRSPAWVRRAPPGDSVLPASPPPVPRLTTGVRGTPACVGASPRCGEGGPSGESPDRNGAKTQLPAL